MAEVLHKWLQGRYGRVVDVPKDFLVGVPSDFTGQVIRRLLGPEPSVDETNHALPGAWMTLRGGPLPVPICMRIDRAEDGRYIITGLLIGLHSRDEITWETLRSIRPAALLAMIFSGIDPREPWHALAQRRDLVDVERMPGEEFDLDAWLRDDEDLPKYDADAAREFARYTAAMVLWGWDGDNPSDRKRPVRPAYEPRASAATDLARVAAVYERHYAATPRRATTATARELNVSRATVLRRLKEARRQGILAEKGQPR